MAAKMDVNHKALLQVAGVPMLLRVIRALALTPEVARIVVCIETPELVADLFETFRAESSIPVEIFPAAGSPSRSVVAALAAFGTPMLVTTADHALLQAEWVSYFIRNQPAQADAAIALARSSVVLDATPDTQRTYLRFADGAYSGCNLFYFATPDAVRLARLWQRVESLRKHPLKMLGLLGWTYALRYRLGRLSLSDALRRLGMLADARAAFVELPFGRAAIDVDKPADLELVERLLRADRGT